MSEHPRLVIRCVLNTFPLQDNKASTGCVLNALGAFNVLLAITSGPPPVGSMSDWVLDRMTSDMKQSKRQLSPDISIAA